MEIPTPEKVLSSPLGTDMVKIGMTKNQVRSLWGEPDYSKQEMDPASGRMREAWVYKATYDSLPSNTGYLSKDRKLYFDGDSLARIAE